MKTIFKSYKLQTNGKILTVSLTALFRAVGIGGDVASGEVPADILDRLHVLVERPGVTGLTELQRGNNTVGYVVDGEKLTIFVTNLPVGISRVFVYTQYGTNAPAALVADLDVPQNVAFLNVAGSYTPLIRAAEKDETVDGAKRYAYVYPHGDTVVWFETETLDLVHEVTVYVASGINSEFADATEMRGRVERNVMAGTYDESEDVTVAPVDTFGGIGGGGGTVEAVSIKLIAPAAIDWTQQHLTVRYLNESGRVAVLDLNANGECAFEVPLGEQYTIVYPVLLDYAQLHDETYTALQVVRSIQRTYTSGTLQMERVEVRGRVEMSETESLRILEGQEVRFEFMDGSNPISVPFDVNNTAFAHVEYGKVYRVVLPEIEGWRHEYEQIIHTAGIPSREILVHYSRQTLGVFGIDADGNTYTKAEIDELEDTSIIIAIGVNTSALAMADRGDGTFGAGFCIKLPASTSNQKWATSNVEFDSARMPFYADFAAASADFKGVVNTENMLEIAEELGIASPAASWVRNQTLVLGGVDRNGFLGSFGQIYTYLLNQSSINAIATACGKTAPNFASDLWWSSSQYNESGACVIITGMFNNTSKSDGHRSVVAFFDL